ncbi:MAG: DNA polymerase IV [Proteobacteria bacterium]|nr:DNA polymerase IV [Pseudomonadota bacterium]MBU1715778.1 DNA polymerase IV [Pseudomonadota bacterium]
MDKPYRQIIHLDMDAFYASVEILDNPTLKGKPVVVGGNSERGVVCAASYEARKFGIHSALSIAKAKRMCPTAIFLPVRMARYQEISGRIMAIFHRYTPLVEPISLDEAFLDVTSSIKLMGPAEQIAKEIKALVKKETGLTVSAGVSTSKLVAKIASDLNKPDGLTIVPAGREREFLADLPIKRLWGIGETTRNTLSLMGIEKIGALSRLPKELLIAKFGKHGHQMHQAAQGIDYREVIPEREVKSIGHEDTFAQDLTDLKIIRREILSLATRVGERMRRAAAVGRTISLKVKYHDFKQITRSMTIPEATNDYLEIFSQALSLLAKTEAGSRPIRLLGISLGSLTSEGETRQIDLFPISAHKPKREQINKALDNIKQKFGKQSIIPATLLDDEQK